MSDAGAYQCRGCGGPLLFGIMGLSCARGRLVRHDTPGFRTGVDCSGEKKDQPVRTRPRNVEKFVCSCGCGRVVKLKPGDPQPEKRECERGGILVYNRTQSR